MRQAVILLLTPPDRDGVLFGVKQQGHARGCWVTPSETMEPGETPRKTALRCVEEEATGIKVVSLRQVGIVLVTRGRRPRKTIRLFIFCGTFTGWPQENEELKRFRLFPTGDLPFNKTWVDASRWMLRALGHKAKRPFAISVSVA